MKLVSEIHLKFQGFKVKREIYTLVIRTVNDAVATIEDEALLESLRLDLLEAITIVKKKQGSLWATRHGYVQHTVKCDEL